MRTLVRKILNLFHDLQRLRKMKKARRHIFIDCGANTCKVLREYISKFRNFEFFAFEPQPDLYSEGQKVISENPDVKIAFYNKAVWTNNETVDFYLATEWGPNYKGGSTLVKEHVRNSSEVDYSHPIQVDAIDFSAWLGHNFTEDDYVIIKMDIEGAEYSVLEKVIVDNNHHIIDELIVEFHQKMNDSITAERHDSLVTKIRTFARLEIWH